MKKSLYLFVIFLLLLCACKSPTLHTPEEPHITEEIHITEEPHTTVPSEEYESSPVNYPFVYDTVTDLLHSISNNQKDDMLKEINGEETKKNFREFINRVEKNFLYIPYYQGKEIIFQNKERFHNIALFPSELYGKPWITFFPDKEKTSIRSIWIMYLDEYIKKDSSQKSGSQLIAQIAPDAPNVSYEWLKGLSFEKYLLKE